MTAVTATAPARPAGSAAPLPSDLAPVEALIARELLPRVLDIDLKAEYPQAFLQQLGALGGFGGVVAPEHGGHGAGLWHTLQVMEAVSRHCLSTGFLVWCQTACARYIQLSDNDAAKARWLPAIARGERLAGTGLSNTMKSADGIEPFRLKARRVEGGFEIDGVLPWVSNLGEDHVFVTGCPAEGGSDLVFFVVDCQAEGVRVVECAQFTALDGTRTLACHFKRHFVPDADVLAPPAESAAYLRRIKPGMILAQMGMGLGLVAGCAALMHEANRTLAHVNRFLDDQVGDIEAPLAAARAQTQALAEALQADPMRPAPLETVLEVLRLRAAGGELSLRAANAAMLHQGAKGYLRRNAAQRRLREAYFVAIVTPAIKHLRKEIARLEGVRAETPAVPAALAA